MLPSCGAAASRARLFSATLGCVVKAPETRLGGTGLGTSTGGVAPTLRIRNYRTV